MEIVSNESSLTKHCILMRKQGHEKCHLYLKELENHLSYF